MSERWMHRPRTVNVWETRSALRWGSQSTGNFKSEQDARQFAEKEISDAGGVGRIHHVERYTIGGTIYYDKYEEIA